MRVTGRVLRPSNLAERRVMLSQFGSLALRVPRGVNPYLLARRLVRASQPSADILFVRDALCGKRRPKPPRPRPSPDVDHAEPDHASPVAAE